MIDLEENYITLIKNTFDNYLSNYKLYIFGSRTKGRAHEYSDIDLAVDSPEFTNQTKLAIENYFADSTIPYKIDIVDLNSITEQFKKLISKDLIEL